MDVLTESGSCRDSARCGVKPGPCCGRYWVRTSDLFRVREARYRCANRPRWRRDLNPCTRICSPLPRLSATPPWEPCSPPDWPRLAPSGRRDSNPRPSPWQGDALPAEPRPRAASGPSRGEGATRNHSRAERWSPNIPGRLGPVARLSQDQLQPGYPDRVTLTSPTSVRQIAVWRNGERLDRPDQAVVPATDHGLVVGDGVFEALKATPAGAFAVQRHLNRLSRSAAAMGLPAPDHRLVREGIAAALDGWPLPSAKVRVTYTGGEGPLGSGAPFGPPTLIVAVEPRDRTPLTTAVVTAPWRRNENGALTGVKSTSYAENVRGLAYAASCGASEAIFLNTAGQVCEGTGTNIFFVFGDEVVTP